MVEKDRDASVKEISISNDIQVPHKIRPSFLSVGRRLSSFTVDDFIIEELRAPSVHLLQGGGKLIRAALVLSSAETLGLEAEKFVDLAVSIEMLHNASLIHDDIIDKDVVRRGLPTVHVKYGEEIAILAGNANIAKAIKYANRYGERVVDHAQEAALCMVAGEILDYNMQKEARIPTLDEYLQMIGLKTASLMAAATKLPATYIGDDTKESALQEIGYKMGLSFQIRDDILEDQGLKERPITEVAKPTARFRPNIVSVFAKAKNPHPLKSAVKLNNFYIGQAREKLDALGNPELFDAYLSFLEIG